jgi:hypothetical protein
MSTKVDYEGVLGKDALSARAGDLPDGDHGLAISNASFSSPRLGRVVNAQSPDRRTVRNAQNRLAEAPQAATTRPASRNGDASAPLAPTRRGARHGATSAGHARCHQGHHFDTPDDEWSRWTC